MMGCALRLVSIKHKLLNLPVTGMSGPMRNISSMEITKNMTLLSDENTQRRIVNSKSDDTKMKPLVVMLPWLMAEKKHVFKFADFYLKLGFDVLNVTITPWQLLWPVKGAQRVATDILKFLHNNTLYSPVVIHGFSVGGYIWGEALVQIAANEYYFKPVLKRIVGQIWDSLADITEIPEGFPFAVFPKQKALQMALRQYINYHLKVFNEVATCHYERASQTFHANILKSPALFFVSKSDPVGSEKSNLRVKEKWENMGIMVHWKCWDETPHVGHFHHHPQEYRTELSKFLKNIGLNWEKCESEPPQARSQL